MGRLEEIKKSNGVLWDLSQAEVDWLISEIERLSKERKWISVAEQMPEYDVEICAILKHCTTGKKIKTVLRRVNEDNCTWRTSEDDFGITIDWDVIYWSFLPEDPKD